MWGQGHVYDGGNLICQQCFGFWRSRYSIFDYVGDFDSRDIYWKEYWDNRIELQLMNLILSIIT